MPAVGKLQHVLVGAGDKVAVDPDLAELVDDDRDLAGVGRAQKPVHQRGLASAEEAREQGDGNALVDRAIVDASHRRLTWPRSPAMWAYSSRIAQARTGAPLPLPILIGGP